MKEREPYKEHFEMLELPLDATFDEVHKAYLLLKETYSSETLATISMSGDVDEYDRKEILERVEEAYRALTEFFKERKHQQEDSVQQLIGEITEYNGAALRRIRQHLKLSLDDVAMATRVQRRHLESIEGDNFAVLPVAVYTRGFVVNYAKHLGLDGEKVARNYMERFKQAREGR